MEVNSDEKTSNDNIDDTSELLEEEKVSTTDDEEAKAKESGEEKAEDFINEESGTADASQITLGDLPDVLEETNENADELGDAINDVDYPIANTDLEHLDSSEIPQLDLYTSSELERQSLEIGDDLLNIVEEDETDEEDDLAYDRDQLLAQYKEALEERSRLQSLNQQCQTQLVEYFKKKKTADEKALEIDKNVTDQEQRYLKYMSNLEELQASEQRQKTAIETQLNELKEKCQEKQSKVEDASDEFEKFKYETGKLSVNSRSGKPIPEKDLENYQATELKKEQEVIAVRLENIKLKNRLKKKEMQLKSKEELAEGLHLIDFEQLKIENQTYNEKIEERNEELLKLRKKITTTVQVLTHLKEKLQFVQGENTEQRLHLKDIDITVAQRRDVLTRIKQVRDALRIDNNKLKHKCGLLGNEALLRDFEDRENERAELTEKLSKLKEAHIQINMNLTTLKKKIEKSK